MKSRTARIAQVFVLLILIIISDVNGQRGRQSCRIGRRGPPGRCLLFSRCPYAIQQVRQNNPPQICWFEGKEPVVCCPRGNQNVEDNPNPLPSPAPPGTKSKKKCEEYTNMKEQAKLQLTPAVVGGVKADAKEFPHMAALGFGESNDIQWLCGGSLISEEYVLTAGHCLFSQELGDVKFVRLGELNLKILSGNVQNFGVASTIRNPGYTPPSQYNDIALVKLDRPVKVTTYVKPACLQTSFELPENLKPIATGWGRLGYTEDTTNDLMKVDLSYFNIEQCKKTYANVPQNRLANGIDGDTQICAGGINESKDTCQGDSGGPLQIKTSNNPKQYSIVGVTSFGKGCGVKNIPGVYTRVSSYINWIEETVWPNS